jgi:DNA-binding CsgD family transcriptional regulator
VLDRATDRAGRSWGFTSLRPHACAALCERQVVGHRLAGHSSKATAHALGISPAAVSAALRSAMLKLVVRNVVELSHRLDPSVTRAAVPQSPP